MINDKCFVILMVIVSYLGTGSIMDDEDSSRCQKLVQDHYCELEAKLNGVQSFIHKMISNKLIAASSKENNFDAIMSEFQTKLQTSRSVTDTFYTFINKVLRELGKDDMANKLMIEWSASPTDATSNNSIITPLANTF